MFKSFKLALYLGVHKQHTASITSLRAPTRNLLPCHLLSLPSLLPQKKKKKTHSLSLLLFAALRKIRLKSLSSISVNIRENAERCSQLSSPSDVSKPEVWGKIVFLEKMRLRFQAKGAPGSRRRVCYLGVADNAEQRSSLGFRH